MIKVGTLAKIRRLYLRDKLPIKEIGRQTGLSRNTVRTWRREPGMAEPKYPVRRVVTKLDAYADTLRTWLKADAGRNKGERRTKGQMWQDLCVLDYSGGYGRVCAFARAWATSQGLAAAKGVFIPLKFKHGEAFQFDWSIEYTFMGGLRRRVELAHTKLCASRAFWLVAYPSQGHEMLFDAHARAFAAFGGVPQRGIYDNMKTAVDKVLSGKKRKVNSRFEAMSGHYTCSSPSSATLPVAGRRGLWRRTCGIGVPAFGTAPKTGAGRVGKNSTRGWPNKAAWPGACKEHSTTHHAVCAV